MFPEWDFSKAWADMKVPNVDVDALIAAQHKNIEAVNMASKAVVDGWQAFAKKQAELWQAAVEDTGALAQGVAAAGTGRKDRQASGIRQIEHRGRYFQRP